MNQKTFAMPSNDPAFSELAKQYGEVLRLREQIKRAGLVRARMCQHEPKQVTNSDTPSSKIQIGPYSKRLKAL